MSRILILTKNISVELYLQEQLQKLNYEVFVSVSMWERWRQTSRLEPFMETCQWIFLSETLSDAEAKGFGEQFGRDCLVRIVGEELSEEASAEWRTWQIFDWVVSAITLEQLREKLVHKKLMYQVDLRKDQSNHSNLDYQEKIFPLYFSDIHFTKVERSIIHQLMEAENHSLTRDALCQCWHSKNQSSKLSQLSSTVTKIRRKVSEAYGIEDAVMTLWGEGYQLSTLFYQCLLKGEYRKMKKRASL